MKVEVKQTITMLNASDIVIHGGYMHHCDVEYT